MLTVALVLFGAVLLALVVGDRAVRRLPLTPAVVYLAVGGLGGALLGPSAVAGLDLQASTLVVCTELAVLLSLFAVGLRLRVPPSLRVWRAALLLAGPGVLVAIVLGMLAARGLLGLPWAAALLLAAILAPTDPVLASEVQIRSDDDRDAVRLSLTAEGALNDGSVFPAVALGLGLLGLHPLGDGGVLGSPRWWLLDLLWPIGGGALLGLAMGRLLGHALRFRSARGDTLARDELLYVGAVALAYGLARATSTSTFVAVFVAGATLLEPLRAASAASSSGATTPDGAQVLSDRLQGFGARIERLVEAATVMAVGVALHAAQLTATAWLFALTLVAVVRPASVLAVVHRPTMVRSQRRLVAWFGIRGIGTLYYLTWALAMGVAGELAAELVSATLAAVALSIVLHGVSATPLMRRYQRRRVPPAQEDPAADGASDRAGK